MLSATSSQGGLVAGGFQALAGYAVPLCRPGRLEAERAGAEAGAELRRYSLAQLLLFGPALIAVVAVAQAIRGRGQKIT